MPIYSVQGPDGRIYDVEGPEGASEAQIVAYVRQQIASAPAEPPAEKKKSGVLASVGRGIESLLSSGRTAIGAATGDANEAARAGLERGEDIGRRYEDDVSLDRVKQAYNERGLLSAAGEVASQVPKAIAGQAPNIAATLGSARLGAMAGSPFGPAGAVIGGVGGAIAPGLVSMFGSNVERQAAEQAKEGRGTNVDVGAAAAAAVPQAALDAAGTFIPLGGRLVSKLIGVPAEALMGKAAAKSTKLADEKLLAVLAKGTAVGAAAEIPTEVAQQMLERAQAGLSLSSPEALAEYGETAYQVSLLAPIGAAGRLSARSGARDNVLAQDAATRRERFVEQEKATAAQAEADKVAAAAEEARKQTPEYAQEAVTNYQTLVAKQQELKGQLRKIEKGSATEIADKEFNKDINAQLAALGPQLKEAGREYNRVQPIVQQGARAQMAADEVRQQQLEQETSVGQIAQQVPGELLAPNAAQMSLPGMESVAATTPKPESDAQQEAQGFAEKQAELAQSLEAQQEAESNAAKTGDIAGLKNLRKRREMLQNEYDFVSKQLDTIGVAPPRNIDDTQKALTAAVAKLKAMAGPGYDPVKADKLVGKIEEMQALIKAEGAQQTSFDFGDTTRTTSSEARDKFAARVYKPGAADIEAQEAAALEESRFADEQALAEAEANVRLSPERNALLRMGKSKNPLSPEINTLLAAKPDDTKRGSSVIGRTAQDLQGKEIGAQGELIYTADEDKADIEEPKVQRVPGTGELRLYNERGERPLDRVEIEARLQRLLVNKNLSDDAFALLRRIENVLPQADYAESTDRVSEGKGKVKRNTARSEGLLTLIDRQLTKIERGLEGMTQQGRGRTTDLQGFPAQGAASTTPPTEGAKIDVTQRASAAPGTKSPIKEVRQPKETERSTSESTGVPVAKRVDDTQPTTLRGASTKAKDLSDQAEIEPLLRTMERTAQEDAGQMGLFAEEDKKLGAIKPDAAAFQRLMKSPYIRTLQKNLPWPTLIRASKALPKLNDDIASLQTKLDGMLEAQKKYKDAERVIKSNADVATLERGLGSLSNRLTELVVNRMTLQGAIDEARTKRVAIEKQIAALQADTAPADVEERSTLAQHRAELDQLENVVQSTLNDVALTDSAMGVLQAQIQTMKALNEVQSLRDAAPFPTDIETTQAQLRAKQTQATKLESDKREIERADTTEARANEQARLAKARVDRDTKQTAFYNERQRRLEAAFGDAVEGMQFAAINAAQRTARERGAPVFTTEENKQLAKDPRQVLGGYRSQETLLERNLQKSLAKSRDARDFQLDGLRNRRDDLLKQYKAAKSSDLRATLGEKYDSAARMVTNAEQKFAATPVTWIGMKKDRAALLDIYNKIEFLEAKIDAGVVSTPEERAPADARVKDSVLQRMAKRAEEQRKAVEDGTFRADAPSTSGEPLLKSEIKKLTQQQQTLYSSKGNTAEVRQKIADDVRERNIAANAARARTGKGATISEDRAVEDAQQANEEAARLRNLTPAQRAKQAKEARQVEQESEPFSEGDVAYQMAATASQGPAVAITAESSVSNVMDEITSTSTNPLNRAVAERLRSLLVETRLRLVKNLTDDKGNPVYGSAKIDGSEISLDMQYGLNEQTVLHEGVHAAVERVLNMPDSQLNEDQRAAKRELQALYEAYKKDKNAPNENAKENLSEFVAEALSDNPLQNYLQSKKWTIQNMWNAVKNGILKMIGVDAPNNMRDAAFAAADRLMTRVVRPTAADANTVVRSVNRPRINPDLQDALEVSDRLVAKQKTWSQQVRDENSGLAFSTRYIDRFAGFEKLAKTMDALKGTQMMYYLRMYDQRMNFVSQSASNGALSLEKLKRADGETEYVVESKDGPSLRSTVEILKDATPLVGDADAVNQLFTSYLAHKRGKRVGFDKLNFSVTEAQLTKAMGSIDRVPGLKSIFEQAQSEYNQYNEGLVRFAQQSGALSKETADKLLATKDYIPYYRQNKDGGVELVIGGEAPIRVGSVKDQPYLHELVGGDEPIFDFFKSSLQNTNLIVDMGLRNLATRNAVMELVGLDAAKVTPSQISGTDVVQFKVDGKDMYARIDTDEFGVNADILVKGMEGIPLQLTGVMRIASIPSRFLRRAITINPLYAARQLFRDSLAAPILAGADFSPVMGALREIGTAAGKTLDKRGITGGQFFTGTQEDMARVMREIAGGTSTWAQAVGRMESFGMAADALTRRAQYNSYIKQGLSEMEATLAALESMNFNKRGASPSIHMANALIPFFNAQIQGLNVLYRAVTGKATQAEKLRLQSKLLTRGALMFGTSLAYAAAMQDDEAYQNATPDQKYGNWFIRIPGFDEPLKLPIPFEVGYIFKALPEALYNAAVNDRGGEDAAAAFKAILRNTIPGGSSMLQVSGWPVGVPIPQAIKPAIETVLGKSMYTGRDILSTKEQRLRPEEQFRENTSELSKMFGGATGLSPIKLDALINGYTGSVGLAILQMGNLAFSSNESPEKAVKRLSDMPVVGGVFQANDAGHIINSTYERLREAEQVKASVTDLLSKGEKAKAMALLQEKGNEYALASTSSWFQSAMQKLTQYETAVRASDKTPEEKRELLDKIRQQKIKLAGSVREAVDRTTPR